MEYTRRMTWKGYRRASYIGLAMGALFLLGGLVSESGVRMLVALAIGSAFLWAGYGVLVGKALARYVLVGLFGLFAAVILANRGPTTGCVPRLRY